MIIKEYSKEYLKDLTHLMNQWTNEKQYTEKEMEDSIQTLTKYSENKIFIAVDAEEKASGYLYAGICYYLGFEPFVEVIQLLVDPGHRSRGIGEMLIRHVEEYYKALGINEIKLHSQMFRERAHAFYQKLGFQEYKQSKFFQKKME